MPSKKEMIESIMRGDREMVKEGVIRADQKPSFDDYKVMDYDFVKTMYEVSRFNYPLT